MIQCFALCNYLFFRLHSTLRIYHGRQDVRFDRSKWGRAVFTNGQWRHCTRCIRGRGERCQWLSGHPFFRNHWKSFQSGKGKKPVCRMVNKREGGPGGGCGSVLCRAQVFVCHETEWCKCGIGFSASSCRLRNQRGYGPGGMWWPGGIIQCQRRRITPFCKAGWDSHPGTGRFPRGQGNDQMGVWAFWRDQEHSPGTKRNPYVTCQRKCPVWETSGHAQACWIPISWSYAWSGCRSGDQCACGL